MIYLEAAVLAENMLGARPADNGSTLWSVSFLQGSPIRGVDLQPPCTEVGRELGMLSTPVIDPTTNTIYLMPFIIENGAQSYRHATHTVGHLASRLFNSMTSNA